MKLRDRLSQYKLVEGISNYNEDVADILLCSISTISGIGMILF
jgi:hypothetical protein